MSSHDDDSELTEEDEHVRRPVLAAPRFAPEDLREAEHLKRTAMAVVRAGGLSPVPDAPATSRALERAWPEPLDVGTKRWKRRVRSWERFAPPGPAGGQAKVSRTKQGRKGPKTETETTVERDCGLSDDSRLLLAYPYIKHAEGMRKTGTEWLLQDADDRIRDEDEDDDDDDDDDHGGDDFDADGDGDEDDDEEELRRWGLPNERRKARVVAVGRALKRSAFGKAVEAFDVALCGAVREREALVRVREGGGVEEGREGVGDAVLAVREPLYRRVEQTLNDAAMRLAMKAVPVGYRGNRGNLTGKRLSRAVTDLAKWPNLPVERERPCK